MGAKAWMRRYDVAVAAVEVPSGDEAAIARGQHLSEAVSLCRSAAMDLGGDELVATP